MSSPRVAHVVLSDVLADWASTASGPLYERLAQAVRGAVERGELLPGTLLPPERVLAAQLAVSRRTVLAAWDLLKAEGWLTSRRGSGTWVSLPQGRRPTMSAIDSMASLRRILHAERDSIINLASGQLEAASALRARTGLRRPRRAGLRPALGAPLNYPAILADMVAYNGGRPLTCHA